MRILLTIALALMLALSPAGAAMAETDIWSQTQIEELDDLFARLKAAPDEAAARALADRIWTIWTQPEDETIAARMKEIIETGGFGGPVAVVPLIDAMVADFPHYSEGWNLRATARFLRGDNDGALADIEEALKREPRHFGALAGRALILRGQGKGEEALAAIKAGLAIHPFLPERHLFPELAPQ